MFDRPPSGRPGRGALVYSIEIKSNYGSFFQME